TSTYCLRTASLSSLGAGRLWMGCAFPSTGPSCFVMPETIAFTSAADSESPSDLVTGRSHPIDHLSPLLRSHEFAPLCHKRHCVRQSLLSRDQRDETLGVAFLFCRHRLRLLQVSYGSADILQLHRS